MKNFRKAALAIATASSVALAGTTAAVAQPEKNDAALSSEWGKKLGTDQKIENADQFFGSSELKAGGVEKGLPVWGLILKYSVVAALVAALGGIGITIGNFLKNAGIIR